MTLETSVPAQLIINGESIDVTIKSVKEIEERITMNHEETTTDSANKRFITMHPIGEDISRIKIYECVEREYKTSSYFG